jgi:hypothetical protein
MLKNFEYYFFYRKFMTKFVKTLYFISKRNENTTQKCKREKRT